jgi:hypothetical protein
MNPPWAFVGQNKFRSPTSVWRDASRQREARKVSAGDGLPELRRPLELNAPDKTERVTCPFCNSLLDVNQGNLKFLQALLKNRKSVCFANRRGRNFCERREI